MSGNVNKTENNKEIVNPNISRPTPTHQAERYRHDYNESAAQKKEALYGRVEQDATGASSVIKPDVTGAAGAAAIKSENTSTAKVVKPTEKTILAEQVKDSGTVVKKQGVIKTVGNVAVREAVASIGHGGEEITDKVKGQTVKYGYKTGKYAALSTAAVTKGTYGMIKEVIKQRKGVIDSNFSPLKKAAAKKIIKDKAKDGFASSGTAIKNTIKKETVQGIEDFHGSEDLGIKALTAPKDIYVKTKRTVTTMKATSRAASSVARKTKKTVKATATGTKKLFAKILGSKIILGVIPVIVAVVVVVAIVQSIVPNVTLKSEDKELTRTYEYITKLDAELTDEIRSIPDNPANLKIDEFHFYLNGYKTSANNITIYTNADYMLMYFDTKYDDYTFNKLISGIFGGTNIKDEIEAIHNTLYSYSTNKWKEEIKHSSSFTDPKTGKSVSYSWTEIVWHLDINVTVQSFEQYLADNITTLLAEDEQERYNVLAEIGTYTARVELGNPFGDEEYSISSTWGWRIHPISQSLKLHKGIDIAKPGGTPIYNVMPGTVTLISYDATGYGNYCTVTSSDGKRKVLYAHMQSVAVSQGQLLNKKDIIGYVGTTGSSTGNHLHLEYSIENGFNTNPAFFLEKPE